MECQWMSYTGNTIPLFFRVLKLTTVTDICHLGCACIPLWVSCLYVFSLWYFIHHHVGRVFRWCSSVQWHGDTTKGKLSNGRYTTSPPNISILTVCRWREVESVWKELSVRTTTKLDSFFTHSLQLFNDQSYPPLTMHALWNYKYTKYYRVIWDMCNSTCKLSTFKYSNLSFQV